MKYLGKNLPCLNKSSCMSTAEDKKLYYYHSDMLSEEKVVLFIVILFSLTHFWSDSVFTVDQLCCSMHK